MIILEPCAGLSNRILAIATTYYYAKLYNHSIIMLWSIDNSVGIAIEELFQLPEDIKIIHVTDRSIRKVPFKRICGEVVKAYYRHKVDYMIDRDFARKACRGIIDVNMEDFFKNYKKLYVQSYTELMPITDYSIFKIFTPTKQIYQRGKSVFEQINENTVGMHIRRTDHADAIAMSPLELFLKKLEELMQKKERTVFLATDDIETERLIKERWGKRIITYENKTFSRTNKEGMKDGLIDMLALSKCQCIYGSYASTFGLMASYLGDKTLITLQEKGEKG